MDWLFTDETAATLIVVCLHGPVRHRVWPEGPIAAALRLLTVASYRRIAPQMRLDYVLAARARFLLSQAIRAALF